MALRFKPVDTAFYSLLASSAAQLVDGAALLAEMLGDGNDREDIAARMREAEHNADETTHEIVRRVNSTFVTPFDREDIYSLASGLDDVMDFMEEAVDLALLYEVAEVTVLTRAGCRYARHRSGPGVPMGSGLRRRSAYHLACVPF